MSDGILVIAGSYDQYKCCISEFPGREFKYVSSESQLNGHTGSPVLFFGTFSRNAAHKRARDMIKNGRLREL